MMGYRSQADDQIASINQAADTVTRLARDIRREVGSSEINLNEKIRKDWPIGLLALLLVIGFVVASGIMPRHAPPKSATTIAIENSLRQTIADKDAALDNIFNLVDTCGNMPNCRLRIIEVIKAERSRSSEKSQ